MQANPTAVVILALALLVIIIAYEGTQANWVAAIQGHPPVAQVTSQAAGKPPLVTQIAHDLTGSGNRSLFGL